MENSFCSRDHDVILLAFKILLYFPNICSPHERKNIPKNTVELTAQHERETPSLAESPPHSRKKPELFGRTVFLDAVVHWNLVPVVTLEDEGQQSRQECLYKMIDYALVKGEFGLE